MSYVLDGSDEVFADDSAPAKSPLHIWISPTSGWNCDGKGGGHMLAMGCSACGRCGSCCECHRGTTFGMVAQSMSRQHPELRGRDSINEPVVEGTRPAVSDDMPSSTAEIAKTDTGIEGVIDIKETEEDKIIQRLLGS